MEQIILEMFPEILRTTRLFGIVSVDTQWTNLTAFYDDLMDKERAVNVIYLDYKKAFDIVFHNILTDREDEVQPV